MPGTRPRWIPVSLMAALVGCGGGEGPTPPPSAATTGSIRIVASTTGIRPDPDGYTVTLDATRSRTVPSDGEVTFTGVVPGQHVLDFTGLARNCVTPEAGTAVGVSAGETSEVSLPVACGRLLFVGGWATAGFSVIETASYSMVHHGLTTGYSPVGAAMSSDGTLIYFSMWSHSRPDRGVGIASAETFEFLHHIPVPGEPTQLALSPDESELYVLHDTGAVSFVDLASDEEVARVEFAGAGRTLDMALSPDGTRLYVTDLGTGRLYILDVPGRRLRRSLVVAPNDAVTVTVAPDGRRVYVRTADGYDDNGLVVVDGSTDQVIDSTPLSHFAWSIIADPDGSVLYVPLHGDARVAVLDASTLVEVGSFPAVEPQRLAIGAEGRHLYVLERMAEVTVVSLESGGIVGRAPTGGVPWNLMVWPPE